MVTYVLRSVFAVLYPVCCATVRVALGNFTTAPGTASYDATTPGPGVGVDQGSEEGFLRVRTYKGTRFVKKAFYPKPRSRQRKWRYMQST